MNRGIKSTYTKISLSQGVFPVMSFTTFKLMQTSQRIALHISILVFRPEMTWLGVFDLILGPSFKVKCAQKT